MSHFENDQEYLESWSAELTAKADRIRQLIGDKHWLTDGHHKEIIVREFLTRYLPVTLNVGSGFIKSLKGGNCSKEVDILISDSSRHPPFFNEGGIQILPPSSTIAYIEMKSSFSAPNLDDAIDAVAWNQHCLNDYKIDVWRCICFASVDRSYESFQKTVFERLEKLINRLEIKTAEEAMNRLPLIIASFESYTAFISKSSTSNEIFLKFFDYKKLSTSIAFNDLFEHIRAYFGNIQTGDVSDFLTGLPDTSFNKKAMQF